MIFHISIRGVVQGVGFRPFIYNLAFSFGLKGYVTNNNSGVLIVIDSSYENLYRFMEQIEVKKPPLSDIEFFSISQQDTKKIFTTFCIKKTNTDSENKTSKLIAKIPADLSICEECKKELKDKNNRRFNYPFITCVNCGPRFSIIEYLPYDRVNTSMEKFIMCKKCKIEYENPKDRRYHAQPIGCFDCGPVIKLFDNSKKSVEILNSNYIATMVSYIKSGKIVAIKGVGGYHIICDATNDFSVKRLRERKKRPSKPFAVMVKDIEMVKKLAIIDEKEKQLLLSNSRPIVLLKKRITSYISSDIAKNISQIGLFLPYTPLLYLILEDLNIPLVVTSANITNEPLCSKTEEILRLSNVWDYCLDNNRDIINSCDDSILFVENNSTFILRLARGYTPKYLKLPKKLDKNILCVGANQKSTIAICIEDKVILSPYIGDLDTIGSIENFKKNIENLQRIYNFKPDIIVCDKHPNYESTKYAKELVKNNKSLKLLTVQHHYAHILATMGINNINTKVLGVSFDGTGYGDDGNLWGGEFIICENNNYKRVAHFKYFKLIGATKAIKEPRRVALSFLFEIYGSEVFNIKNNTTVSFSRNELKILYQAWKKGLNSPLSSSCGRLFDAVASIVGICQINSFDGQSGLLLENLYNERVTDYYSFSVEDNQINLSKIIIQILNEKDKNIVVSKFFNTIIEIIYFIYKKYNLPLVVSGGVFQNRILLRLLISKIPNAILPKEFVSNDSAISYGQAIAFLKKLKIRETKPNLPSSIINLS